MEALLGASASLLFVLLFLGLVFVVSLKNILYLCGPNEVLIFSGRGERGYRLIKGGRGTRVPLFESVDRMDLTNMPIEISVTNAYSKGGIPLSVQGVANVKIAGHEPALNNAIERFLGLERVKIMQIAKDTLEGNLRGVLAQLTPEQVNQDKNAFAEQLLAEAEHDLTKLGLLLDNLKIQNVTDEKGYLNSIGRKQSADLNKRARVAEVQAKTQSAVKDAANRQRARIQEIDSSIEVTRAETQRRVADTMSRRNALVAEEIGRVQAAIAKAESELKVREAQVEQARRKLEADVVAPAQAEMEAKLAEARGAAARIIEDGKANNRVLEQMIATWQAGGENSRDIFLMQKLQNTLGSLVETIGDVRVDKLTVLPPDAGTSARTALTLNEEVKGAIGLDMAQVLERLGGRVGATTPPPAPPAPPAPAPAPTVVRQVPRG